MVDGGHAGERPATFIGNAAGGHRNAADAVQIPIRPDTTPRRRRTCAAVPGLTVVRRRLRRVVIVRILEAAIATCPEETAPLDPSGERARLRPQSAPGNRFVALAIDQIGQQRHGQRLVPWHLLRQMGHGRGGSFDSAELYGQLASQGSDRLFGCGGASGDQPGFAAESHDGKDGQRREQQEDENAERHARGDPGGEKGHATTPRRELRCAGLRPMSRSIESPGAELRRAVGRPASHHKGAEHWLTGGLHAPDRCAKRSGYYVCSPQRVH